MKFACAAKYIVLLAVVIMAIDVRAGVLFLLVSLAINILANSKDNNKMTIENYTPGKLDTRPHNLQYVQLAKKCENVPKRFLQRNSVDANRFCNDGVLLEVNKPDEYRSINQQLVGDANPKTKVQPVMTTPIYSLAQRDNDLVVPNIINGQTNENLFYSGYITDQTIDTVEQFVNRRETVGNSGKLANPGEAKWYGSLDSPLPSGTQKYSSNFDNSRENYEPVTGRQTSPNYDNYKYNNKMFNSPYDFVNTQSGYNKEQLFSSGYPANCPQGNCAQSPVFKQFNDNLFTQTVQPGVYYKDQVIEPINSNIGISFTQPFLPSTHQRTANGGIKRVDHDPIGDPVPEPVFEELETPTPDNVYDPRLYGYGTSYRNYVDTMTGQPRFYYDDINAIRNPNYIVRSKIDTHVNYGDVYGPMQNTGIALNDIKPKANDSFMDDTMNHRNDMMEKLMRKNNAIWYQRRQAPIHFNGMAGVGYTY